MGVLDNLFVGPGATSNQSGTTTTQMPAWYQDASRGIAAHAIGAAAQPRPQYGGPRVAGWAPEHVSALNSIKQNQGAWTSPVVGGINALNMLPGQIAPTLQQAGANAGAAAGAVGPTMMWPDNYKQYLSPYTASVVDEIGRVGTRNLTEKLLPAANDAFVGAGGFGSTRNAEILARTMREAGADILGQQTQALESGYRTGAEIFGADANRDASAGAARGNLMLQGANTAVNAANQWTGAVRGAVGDIAGLARQGQAMQGEDINRLVMAGDKQQNQVQKQLDVNYGDFTEARDWDMNRIGALTQILGNMKIPTSTTSSQGSTSTPAQPSGLQWLMALASAFGGES